MGRLRIAVSILALTALAAAAWYCAPVVFPRTLKPGEHFVITWSGKPVFVRQRSPAKIERAVAQAGRRP